MKVMKSILIVCISLVSELAFSQPMFTNGRSSADSLREEGNLSGAITEFKKIYAGNPMNKNNVYNYACALSLDRQFDSCFKYLTIAVGLDTSSASLVDPDFLPVRQDKGWEGFENKLISMLNVKFHNPYKDIDYARALWKMKAYDQAYFSEITLAERKTGMKSTVVRALWEFKFMINEKNQKELEVLIAKKGWPKNSEVGSTAAGAAFYVIQHADVEKQKKYVPMLKQRCEEKEASWQNYALLYDRMRMNENKPQKYGTQTRYIEQTDSIELYPLEDETKVDEWRKEIGLPPLAEYLAGFDIKFQPKKK
jgi:hypothetical protein